MIEYFNPRDLPYPQYGISPGAATSDLVFAGGMALDFTTMNRLPQATTIAEETRLVFEEISSTLEAAGSSLRDVVKTTCWLADDSYRMEFLQTYTEIFSPGPFPARSTFVVGIFGDCRVEVDAIAVRRRENT